MEEKIGLILLVESTHKPYIWSHVETIANKYKQLHDNMFTIVCGHGLDKPLSDLEVDEVVWENSYKANVMETFIEILPLAMNEATRNGCDKFLIVDDLTWMENNTPLLEKFWFAGNLSEWQQTLDLKILYGKVETVRNIIMNRPWNPLLDQRQNMFRNFANVLGKKRIESFLFDDSRCKIYNRVVISRDYWEDRPC
jgi:hypothetical protein